MRLSTLGGDEGLPMAARMATATVVVLRKRGKTIEALLEKRGAPPMVGAWSIPGGHLKPGESPQHAAVRELWEETGIKVAYVEPLEGDPSAPDRAAKDYAFATIVDPATEVRVNGGAGGPGESDAAALKWVDIGKIPPLAFGQEKLVYDAMAKLFGEHAAVQEAIGAVGRTWCSDLLLEYDHNPYHGSGEKFKDIVKNLIRQKPSVNNGLLVVFEGIDGAGKSLQVDATERWLKELGYDVVVSQWNSSPILHKSVKKAKQQKLLSPILFCLLHAADLVLRYEQDILPALERNQIVICDRYVYTSAARDRLRGVNVKILDTIYEKLRAPDILFHASVPIHIAFARILKRKGFSYYGTGSDLHLADNYEDNYVKYEKLLDDEYNKILPEQKNYHRLDMNQAPDKITDDIKKIIADVAGIGRYAREQPNRPSGAK